MSTLSLFTAPLLSLVASDAALDDQEPRVGRPVTWSIAADRRDNLHGFGTCLVATPDADGDGVPDVLFGAPCLGTGEVGYAELVSGATGERIFRFEGASPEEEFGFAVAAGCDLDRDGSPEIAIGARAAEGEGARRGRVVLYDLRTKRELLVLTGAEDHGFFGEAVLVPGDVDGDGFGDLVVGAPGSADAAGHALLFVGPGGRPDRTLRGRRAGDAFGTFLSALEDLNDDGHADFAVGAPFAGSRPERCGSLVAVSGRSGRPLRTLFGPATASGFGCAAANAGDVDGDGTDDLLVGAPGTPLGGQNDVGWVGLYSGTDGSSLGSFVGERAGDSFGRTLAGGFDWNGDGQPDWVAGAPFGRGRSDRERAGYVVVRDATGVELERFRGRYARGLLGTAIAVGRDEQGRLTQLFAGAPGRAPSAFGPEPDGGASKESRPGRVRRLR